MTKPKTILFSDEINDFYDKVVSKSFKEELRIIGIIEVEHRRGYNREYNQRPEVKKYYREYKKRPEVKEHQREYYREYCQRPEVGEHRREYRRAYYQEHKKIGGKNGKQRTD